MESSKPKAQSVEVQPQHIELNSFEVAMVAHEMNSEARLAQSGTDWDAFDAACSTL